MGAVTEFEYRRSSRPTDGRAGHGLRPQRSVHAGAGSPPLRGHARQLPGLPQRVWGLWVAARHATLRDIGRDAATFPSGEGVTTPRSGHDRTLVPTETDGARHARYREILLPHLGPRAVADLSPRVRGVARAILDDLRPRGGGDVYELYGKWVPAEMITVLLSVQDEPEFWTGPRRSSTGASSRPATRERGRRLPVSFL